MKIERISSKLRMTIEQFAEEHDLVMQVREPVRVGAHGLDGQYQAMFKGAEVSEGGMLSSGFGLGSTEADAINEYSGNISCKTLRLRDGRRIHVPDLIGYATW